MFMCESVYALMYACVHIFVLYDPIPLFASLIPDFFLGPESSNEGSAELSMA